MATIKKETIEKINAKCSNNWAFDCRYFIFHNEKTLVKNVKLNDNEFLQAKLYYRESYKNFEKTVTTMFHISKYYQREDSDFASSSGLGQFIELENVDKKSIDNLCKLTAKYDSEEIKRLYN